MTLLYCSLLKRLTKIIFLSQTDNVNLINYLLAYQNSTQTKNSPIRLEESFFI